MFESVGHTHIRNRDRCGVLTDDSGVVGRYH